VRIIKLVLAILFSIVIVSCGGSGSNTPAATTATGYFIDSAVQGLSYVSGGQTGTTGANGKFTYEVGKTIKFFIGNIVLGETSAKGVMTPVDLVPNADATNPQVLKITQFLMTIDSDGNPTNGITISGATNTAAQSTSPIDFATATDATLTTALAALTATNTLVTVSAAQTHLTSSIYGLYAGTYSGTFSGTDSGVWTATIDSSGVITGTGTSLQVGGFSVSGQISTSGASTFSPSGGTSTGATFTGNIDVYTGTMSGTWSNSSSGGSGTWMTTTPGGVSQFNRTYTGSASGTLVSGGSDNFIIQFTVANGTLVTVDNTTGTVTSSGAINFIAGGCASGNNGVPVPYGTMTGQINISLAGVATASGTWSAPSWTGPSGTCGARTGTWTATRQ
jgi:hypothetical protein